MTTITPTPMPLGTIQANREWRQRWIISNEQRPILTRVYERGGTYADDPWSIVYCPTIGSSLAYAYTFGDESAAWRYLLATLREKADAAQRIYSARKAEWQGVATQTIAQTIDSRPIPIKLLAALQAGT